MNSRSAAANEATERVAQEWRERGYQVLVEPRFLEGLEGVLLYYKPDLIAIKGDDKFIIEVKSKGAEMTARAEAQLHRVRELLKDHPDWVFKVIYYGEAQGDLPIINKKKLLEALCGVDAILAVDSRLALLHLWSVTEAMVRHQYPALTHRPQSPGRLVELLAGQGDILPSQAAHLRTMSYRRNKFIHGDLNVAVTPEEVMQMQCILSEVLSDLLVEADGGS